MVSLVSPAPGSTAPDSGPESHTTRLRSFAERILCAETLAEKLLPPGAFLDLDPGPALLHAPAAPGRPAALRLDRAPDARAAMPAEGRLCEPGQRGRLLHAFANHELLALELFALALLRFPDAPAPFRLGLGRVMAEEQAHLRGYLARMQALGVSFGDEAPSAFFWTSLAPARTLPELVAGLSLTFEQANLDFAAHFAGLLRRLGDEETAGLLERVLADEVGHVHHGLTWFERWREPSRPLWEAWVAALPPPLVPRRARGRGELQREARRQAGLPDEFVRRLALAGESTGRTPVVHAFLPGFEHELAGEPLSRAAQEVARDQGALPLFLARTGDVVVVPAAPDPAWLEALAAAGVTLPELVVGDLSQAARALAGRPLSGLAPWGWGPSVRAGLGPLFAQVRPGPGAWLPDEAHARALPELAAKPWAAERLAGLLAAHPEWAPVVGERAPEEVGVLSRDEEAVRAAALRITSAGRWAVLKAPWGTSGRGALRLPGPPDPAQVAWIRRTLAGQGALLVEPWLERVADLSVQLDVQGEDQVRLTGVTRFLADRRGQYAGHVIGPHTAGLEAQALRLLAERAPGRPSGLEVLKSVARAVGRDLARAGHRGPAGVDALLHREPGGRDARDGDPGGCDPRGALRLRPLVEVNPRTTMGRVALALGERVAPGRVGLWLHVPAPRARKAGHASLQDLACAARATLPIRLEGQPPRLVTGALCTNDPAAARVVLGLLVVDRDLEACQAGLARLGLSVPPPRGGPG